MAAADNTPFPAPQFALASRAMSRLHPTKPILLQLWTNRP